jgi:glycosyltransferase involved in cell wall biosynthesis
MPAVTVASRVLEERSMGLGQKNVYYLPNCLADSSVPLFDSLSQRGAKELKAEFGIPDLPLVLYAGHFSPADDLDFLCRSMQQVLLKSNAMFAVIGDGPELNRMRSFFVNSDRARFFGRLSYERFLRVVHACDIAVFPYPSNPVYRAKCSARIIDFMAAGKPVVTTEVGQNGEYIQDGRNGVLVPQGNEAAFVQAVMCLISDKSERERLGTDAARTIREHFLWSGRFTENCEAAYEKATTSA